MGNDPNKYISLHIKDEDKVKVLSEVKNEEFYKLYKQCSKKHGYNRNKLYRSDKTAEIQMPA